MKDIDFLVTETNRLDMSYDHRKQFFEILNRDIIFLLSNNLMDYSLLVTTANKKHLSKEKQKEVETLELEEGFVNWHYNVTEEYIRSYCIIDHL